MKQSKKADAKRKERQDIERQQKKTLCELIGGTWQESFGVCHGNCPTCGKERWLELSHEPPKGMGGTTREYSTDEDAENQVKLRCHKCHLEGQHHEKIITDSKLEWRIK